MLILLLFQGSIPLSWKGTRLRRRFSHFWWIWRSGTCRPSSSGHCTCQYPGSDVFCLSLFCQGYRFTWFFSVWKNICCPFSVMITNSTPLYPQSIVSQLWFFYPTPPYHHQISALWTITPLGKIILLLGFQLAIFYDPKAF